MRMAVVTPIPTPYRDPFWGVVNAMEGVALDVYYCASEKPDRPWQVTWPREFNYYELPSWNLAKYRGADASAYWVSGLQRHLRHGGYDAAIIGGYNHPCMLAAMRTCVRADIPYFLACETYRSRNGRLSFARNAIVRRVCKAAAGGLPTGTQASKFLADHGIGVDLQIRIPNVPDVVQWQREVAKLREDAPHHRAAMGIGEGEQVLVFVGRMIPKKRPDLLINAFADADVQGSKLVMIGSGPMLEACRQLAASRGISQRVLFPGFCDQDAIRRWYSVSQVFVMPSTETWGVAPIEALASGLPVILSDEVGCHPDVVRSAADGWVVKAGCRSSLRDAIGQALSAEHRSCEFFESVEHMRNEFAYTALAKRLIVSLDRLVCSGVSGVYDSKGEQH